MALPYAEQPMSVSWNVCIQRLLSLKSGHNSARAELRVMPLLNCTLTSVNTRLYIHVVT
jgi:hypothetical protein